MKKTIITLDDYLKELKEGKRVFENAFQSVSRMILEDSNGIKETVVRGKTFYDFEVFRKGKKHLIGMHEEINNFVSYVKDAAEGGSSAEMAFVLVGEPGNGKTFFVEYLCDRYREFLRKDRNRKFTFQFNNLNQIGGYGQIETIRSQTFEDPVIMAMNLFESFDGGKEYLRSLGFKNKEIDTLYENHRYLGACSSHILDEIRAHCDGDVDKMKEFIDIVPVPMSPNLGTITGKYPAKDKITSSSVDLLGEESIQRMLNIKDTNNPYRFNVARGALARVAGGGIHFSDEMFKNKKDLVKIYLGVIQNRTIEIDGYKWPIDTLIVATSNNTEYNNYMSEGEEAPIVDRCRVCYVSHNTDYRSQKYLTEYAVGNKGKTTLAKKSLHQDPNLEYAASVAVTLSRLPRSEKLTPIETMNLSAGEVAGEKSIKTLTEVEDELNSDPDITRRFGQRGLGQRSLGRAFQLMLGTSATNKGQCMYAKDIFVCLERIILDYVHDAGDRAKYFEDIKIAKGLYREHIEIAIFNAYMDEPQAIKKDVMNYVNMVIGIDASTDNMWSYEDAQTGERVPIKIDEKHMESIESRLEIKNDEQRKTFRNGIRRIYGQKISTNNKDYDFMDNVDLVKAITDVKLKSDVSGAGSLSGALANRTNEENQNLYNRMIDTMINKLGYCKTCAEKTIEYFCTQEDEN